MAAKKTPDSPLSLPPDPEITADLIEAVRRRISENKRVRRTLPGRGRLHVDRQLPFLCVYRQPPDREDAGTERLVKGEAAYLVAPGAARHHKRLAALVRAVAAELSSEFGAVLIAEVWSTPDGGRANDPAEPAVSPAFTVHASSESGLTSTVEALQRRLRRIKVMKQKVEVHVLRDDDVTPPGLRPLLTAAQRRELNCRMVGIAVPPVYRSAESGQEFPLLARSLRRSLGLALRQSFFEFARSQTSHRAPHYHALGRRAVVKAVWEVDKQLADVSNAFDYLLQLTPVNSVDAWNAFRRSGFQQAPELHYRPLPMDPSLLKRRLFAIPLERVEDPALHVLFRQKQNELERKITMLEDRDTPRFLYGSLQLFGRVEPELVQLAQEILNRFPAAKSRRSTSPPWTAQQFADRVRQEFLYYRRQLPDFSAEVVITGEVTSLLVSRDCLMIAEGTVFPESRVEALLAHEVGTHLLTYFNGRAQPFRQLATGLAGYEELQEGLAVLSEYLVGGLGRNRLRQLAARVVAAHMMVEGAGFVETFRELDTTHRFSQKQAFQITVRLYRGGGLTKDIVYLRGLRYILDYLQRGEELDPLLVGKMAADQIPVIRELRFRHVLTAPPLAPRYLTRSDSVRRLEAVRRENFSVLDLVSD